MINDKKRSKPDFGNTLEMPGGSKQDQCQNQNISNLNDAYRNMAEPSILEENAKERLLRLMENASRELDRKGD